MNILAEDLEFWMTKLPHKLKTIPIIHLAIPGSHDSTTYAITEKSTMSPDARTSIQYLKFLEPVLRPVMLKWSKTQINNITEQLRYGIRYFDLRVATKANTDAFYFVHNLYSEQVDPILNAIKQFLDTHPKEVLILDCQHCFKFNFDDHQRFIALITSIFGEKMVPYMTDMSHLTLKYITEFNFQVMVIYRSLNVQPEGRLWPSVSFPTPWPNTVSVPKLIMCLDDGLKSRDYSLGFVSQCVLTPTLGYVCWNLFSSLESKCVLPLEKQKYIWLREQKPGIGGINVVISDFVDFQDYQFPKDVISLNRKLLDDETFHNPVYT